jgi:non-ribosomal peptide synthetase component F/acyl carrier protein
MNAVLKPTASGGLLDCIIPTTEAQREIWLGATLSAEASMAYNESVVLRLRGALDGKAMARATVRLLERHQALRATISPDGTFMLVSPPGEFSLVQQDLGGLDAEARAQALRAGHDEAVCTPFSLEHGPLFRAVLYRLGDAEHELVMSAHHVVCDGWSWAVITEQLGHLYAEETGVGLKLKAAPLFADFAAEEAAAAASADMQPHIDYWLGRFSGNALPVLDLPLDRPRPAVRTFNSHRTERLLDKRLVGALRSTSTKAGVSLFTGLLSGFVATLHRLTGHEDIVVGIPASGQLAHDMPGLVGHCVNLLPLRLAANAGMRFDALMDECSTAVLDAFDHQALTYGALLNQLSLERDPSRLPLVSVAFNVDPDVASSAQAFTTLDVVQDTIARRYENFELFVNLRPLDGGLQVEAQYNTDLFDEVSVQRWLDMFACVLQSASHKPDETVGRLEVLSADAAHSLLALQPARVPLVGAPLAHAGFLARVPLQPDHPAVRDGARSCSFGELDALSNRLARALRARGVGRGQRVGLCLERSFEMVLAMLGILKAGAAYVPLDTSFPQARLDHYATDASLSLMLTTSDIAAAPRDWRADAALRIFELDSDTAWRQLSGDALAPSADDPQSEDAAYVIYTSGSTGLPKGVVAHHRGVAYLLQWMQRESGIGPADRIAAVTTLSFDMAVPDLLLPLAAGAELVMVQREVAMDGNRLSRALEEEKITLLQATPRHVATAARCPVGRRHARFPWLDRRRSTAPEHGAGPVRTHGRPVERLRADRDHRVFDGLARSARRDRIARRVDRPAGRQHRDLDPRCRPAALPDRRAGRNLHRRRRRVAGLPRPARADCRALRHGAHLRQREEGVPHRRPRPLAQRRAARPPGPARLPGQGARLPHRARRDRGPLLRSGRCLPQRGRGARGQPRRRAPGGLPCTDAGRRLRPRCADGSPAQAPAGLHAAAARGDARCAAHAANGKVDRVSLPPPQAAARNEVRRGAGPRNEHERKVLAVMEKVLSLPGLDMHDNFFTMGGHSLLAARLTTLLSREFQVTLPLRTLFEAPTAEKLAAAIQACKAPASACRHRLPAAPNATARRSRCRRNASASWNSCIRAARSTTRPRRSA